MTLVTELLIQCRQKNVFLWTDGGRIRYRAPKGAITPELKERLKAQKEKLLKILSGRKYLVALSGVLNRKIIISWDGHNPNVIYVDSTPYSEQEIQRLKQLNPMMEHLQAIHEIKDTFDGNIVEQ